MHPKMPEQQPTVNEPKDIVNLAYNIASIHLACITPLLRSGFGTRAFAGYPLALILMMLYIAGANCELLAWYLPVWLLLIVFRCATADRNQHSRYQGYPWVFGWFVSERVAKLGEAFICFFAAVFLSFVSEPLAEFVMAEIISIFIVLATESATLEARRRAMRDEQIMAQQMIDLQRGKSVW